METGAPYELLLVPLALLATLAGLFLLARRWRQRAQAELEQMRANWRRFDSARQKIEMTVQAFSGEEQEPFRSRLADLNRRLDQLDHQAARLNRRRIDLKQQANNLSVNSWQSIVGGSFLWYALRRDLQQLEREMASAWEGLKQAEEKDDAIRRIGWEIALQAREARGLQHELQAALGRLADCRLQGSEFEAVRRNCQELGADLERLDPDLFSADEDVILSRLDRGAVAQSHKVVGEVRPSLETLLAKAGEWERGLTRAGEAIVLLDRMLDEAETALAQLPASVDADATRQQLSTMRQIAQNLNGTLARPAADSLSELVDEAERQFRLAQELREGLKRTRREGAALDAALKELPAAFKDLSLQMATLAAKSVRPVQWQSGVDMLTDLTRKTNKLGGQRPRPPEKITADLKTAADLRARQKELTAHFNQVSEAHSALVVVLADPRLTGLADWLNETRPLMTRAEKYSPDNFPRQAGAAELPGEIEALAEEAERLGVQRPSEVVNESEIEARLEQTQTLIDRFERVQQRAAALRVHLEELAAAETAAVDLIERVRAALSQMEFLADSNEFLNGLAAGEMKRQAGEADRLLADLNDRRQGRVELKARQADALAGRVEAAANRWLDQLGREIGERSDELAGLLRALDEIAALEEKPVLEARRLLSSGAGFSAAGRVARASFDLDDLVPELKRRSDVWNSLNAAVHALQDYAPLIETYQTADEQRQQARRALDSAAAIVRQKRAWPPTTASFDDERRELEAIDAEWQALRERGGRAIARTAQLGGLAARSQALSDRIAQTAERAARERTEVEELEAQVNEMAENWRTHLHQYREYPEAAAEIQALLEDIHHILAQIRRDYIQGGADYAATLQAIKTLVKRVRYYQVALDDQSALDVNGNVQRRRESRRV